jgi:hypothetical protein
MSEGGSPRFRTQAQSSTINNQPTTAARLDLLASVHWNTIQFPSLKNSQTSTKLIIMNAAEIIQEIERLPENEKGKVVDFMRHLPNQETLDAMEEARHPEKLEQFDSAADMFKKLGVEC